MTDERRAMQKKLSELMGRCHCVNIEDTDGTVVGKLTCFYCLHKETAGHPKAARPVHQNKE